MKIERDLLGLCIKSRKNFEKAMQSGLQKDFFTDSVCGEIWEAMAAIDSRGENIDAVSIMRGCSGETAEKFFEIINDTPLTMNVEYFIKEICNAFTGRIVAQKILELNHAVKSRKEGEDFSGAVELTDAISDLLRKGITAAEKYPRSFEVIGNKEWLTDLENRLTEQRSSGIPTGFDPLNQIFNGGWQRGHFYVFAARPGKGKTTFAISSAIAAAESGARVLFATIEMDGKAIFTKAISNRARVVGGKYLSGNLTEEETDRTMHGFRKVSALPIVVDDKFNGRLADLSGNLRREIRRGGIDLLVVDYLSLCSASDKIKTTREQMIAVSGEIKKLAQELNVAVLALSQLNRFADMTDSPGLGHLAESDSIGRDADAVIVFSVKGKTELSDGSPIFAVVKNRWGRSIEFEVEANLSLNSFVSLKYSDGAFSNDK